MQRQLYHTIKCNTQTKQMKFFAAVSVEEAEQMNKSVDFLWKIEEKLNGQSNYEIFEIKKFHQNEIILQTLCKSIDVHLLHLKRCSKGVNHCDCCTLVTLLVWLSRTTMFNMYSDIARRCVRALASECMK